MNNNTAIKEVIKFYSDESKSFESLGDNKISFVNACKFNDPFDPSYDMLYHAFHSEKNSTIKEKYSNFLEELKDNLFFCSMKNENEEQIPKYLLEHYMWAHYANGFRGIAVVFDAEKMIQSINSSPPPNVWTEITYFDEVPSIDPSDSEDDQNLIAQQIMASKSLYWKNEREVRLTLKGEKGKEYRCIELLDDTIKRLFTGLSFSFNENNTAYLKKIQYKHKNCKFYSSQRKDGTFKWEFKMIDKLN